ncbi:inositol/phosphatidylinositol phosphatase [Cyathus striatus]|nr:inositol/phosphatidylinositol phosphatase [Cyathus striatus]
MSSSLSPLHQRLRLYVDNEAYTFVPDTGEPEALVFHRLSGDVQHRKLKAPLNSRGVARAVYGIIGSISLTLSEYLIVITARELRGRFMGHDVFRATKFDILPMSPNISAHNPPHEVEAHLLGLVRSHFYTGNFLFSYTFDLTTRLQVQWENKDAAVGKPLWSLVDDRFFWNKFLMTKFTDTVTSESNQSLFAYILPIMYGTFEIRPLFLLGRHMQLALISRRSRYRAGTRYFRRGIDEEGHVANFNETEQILLLENPTPPGALRQVDDNFAAKLSFVQIRGSVPLFWSEINTLRYKPDLQIMDRDDTAAVMKKHLMEQVNTYGEQSLVNLINKKGHEQPVKEAYERYVELLALPNTRYEYFDFHSECKNMQWDRISVLIDRMIEDIDRHGYFQVNTNDPNPVKVQKGVVRTNCMDNLDRTNVVQAALAKWTLNVQLRHLGILGKDAGVDDYEDFSKTFREMWADHADAIAKAYGGSGALKSDFTRTNKRTSKGVLEDGLKSLTRYLRNTFFDGPRQDGFDLVTGNWVPRKNPSTSLSLVVDTRPLLTRAMPVVISFSIFMILAGLTLPRSSDYSIIYYFLIWFSILSFALIFMLIHGIDFVVWPKLIPMTDIIYYKGDGFRSARHGMGLKLSSVRGAEKVELENRRKRDD